MMTKRQAISEFRCEYKGAHKDDPHARKEEWIAYVDRLCDEGLLDCHKVSKWKYPFKEPYLKSD